MRLCAVLLLVLAVPLVGLAAGTAADRSAAVELAALHRTTATLTADAPAAGGPVPAGVGEVPAPAAWTAPGGERLTGSVLVGPGTAEGTVVEVWTDARGAVRYGPGAPSELRARAVVAGLGAAGLTAAVVLAGRLGALAVIDARRARAWEREWEDADRRWDQLT